MASRVPRRPPAGRCATLGVGGSRPRWSLAGEPLRRPPLTSSELAMVSHRGERLRTGFNSLLNVLWTPDTAAAARAWMALAAPHMRV